MKSESDVLSRLKKLKGRYLNHYLRSTQSRVHSNCVHNYIHTPRQLPRPKEIEFEIAPRHSNSLVVIQPSSSIRICTVGSKNPGEWNGDICDEENDAAPNCSYFSPIVSPERALEEFDKLLSDDKYVLERYPDIAALQWVTGSRVHKVRAGFFEFFFFILSLFFMRFARKPKNLTEGVPTPEENPSSDFWDDDAADSDSST